MTLKTAIHTVSLFIAASASSLALASGSGVDAGANVQVAVPVAGQSVAPDVAKDVKGTANGMADTTGTTADAVTDKTRSSVVPAADAKADTHLAAKKSKLNKTKSGKPHNSDDGKTGENVKGEAPSGS